MPNIKSVLSEAFRSIVQPKQILALNTQNFSASVANTQLVSKAAALEISAGKVQNAIRPVFGKSGDAVRGIGDHPDFLNLKDTENSERHYIVTLFMDIAGSTRLSRIHELEDVKRIKNGFMRMAIELVQAFDGHVHRLQGDSVMAYFGGRHLSPEQACIDALNAASMILLLSEKIVAPELRREGYDKPPGIRVGLDYGPNDQVLWSSYGYPGTSEVTATSYFVDVASKLQRAAPKDGVMIGQSLAEFLDVPDELLKKRTYDSGGEKKDELYVVPNHTHLDGTPFNYRQFQFLHDRYLECTAVGQLETDLTNGNTAASSFGVTIDIYDAKNGNRIGAYAPSSRALHKENWLKFKPQLPILKYPVTITYSVENHGEQAKQQGGTDCGNHSTDYKILTPTDYHAHFHWEHTAFRGLHYMTIKVVTANGLAMKNKVGVYVE